MIAIINTAVANLTSVANAVERTGRAFKITTDPETIQKASHVILPGVGHAQASMKSLEQLGLIPLIKDLDQPVLGICLGMQLLYQHTEEGDIEGLGVLPGIVQKIKEVPGLALPHMGWNTLHLDDPSSPLLRGIFEGDRVYFVHSFRAPVNEVTRASTVYGEPIAALVSQDNYFGTQFHPERSGAVGFAILRNFLAL
jgi:glutamine amidotransferase